VELRSWYLFDSRFCNVAKGNEKGHVENLVKRSQRTFLTPLPEIPDLDTLNAKLAQDCLAELDRTDREGQSYRTLWEAEKPCLLPLPAEAFPACRERSSIVDKQSLVQFDGHLYSVPVRWAYHSCVLKGFVDRVGVCVRRRAFSVEAVVAAMRNEPLSAPVRRLDLAHRPELAGVGEGIRPVSLYDQLAQEGEEVAA